MYFGWMQIDALDRIKGMRPFHPYSRKRINNPKHGSAMFYPVKIIRISDFCSLSKIFQGGITSIDIPSIRKQAVKMETLRIQDLNREMRF
jgi:hypothetical protein